MYVRTYVRTYIHTYVCMICQMNFTNQGLFKLMDEGLKTEISPGC